MSSYVLMPGSHAHQRNHQKTANVAHRKSHSMDSQVVAAAAAGLPNYGSESEFCKDTQGIYFFVYLFFII